MAVTMRKCNSRIVISPIFSLFMFVALLIVVPAFAGDFILFDDTAVTNVGYSDYTDPRDDAPGQALHVNVAHLPEAASEFVPMADDLFEELFVRRIDGSELDHAMIVLWRTEGDDPAARRYGEDVYYDRGNDGAWTRVSHADQRVRESNFGPLYADQVTLESGVVVTFYPPIQGYLASRGNEVLLARFAADVDLDDVSVTGPLFEAFLNEYIMDAMVIEPEYNGGPAAFYLRLYNELPQTRFGVAPNVVANINIEHSSE